MKGGCSEEATWGKRRRAGMAVAATALAVGATVGFMPKAASAATVQNPWAAQVYAHSVSQASAQVTVPTVACPPTGYSALATWVGLDGWSNLTVEQVGFTFACSNGQEGIGPWYQMYPAPAQALAIAIRPGDQVALLEQWAGSASFVSSITDLTTGAHVSVTDTDPGAARSSAECVTEDFGPDVPASTVAFSSCLANGTVGIPGSRPQVSNIDVDGQILSAQHTTSSTAFYQTFSPEVLTTSSATAPAKHLKR